MDTNATKHGPVEAHLGLWDAVSIIVGIIIGVGIFVTPPSIFSDVPHPALAIGLWIIGGALALVGALCYAELASAYPRSGGEYVYLSRAFGPVTGFLFAWSQLTVTRSGSIAALAYVFGSKAATLFPSEQNSLPVIVTSSVGLLTSPLGPGPVLASSAIFPGREETPGNSWIFALAGLSVVILTLINIFGVRTGSRTQNFLTVAKVLGLVALIVVGFGWGAGEISVQEETPVEGFAWLAGPMIFILWTYSGWHEAAYIVAEAKNRTRNIPLALILGTAIVTVVYILVNLACLYGLNVQGARRESAAADLIRLAWPAHGACAMNILIMVSALGAMNGMIFTSARIYSEFGADHRVFKVLSHWSKRWKLPPAPSLSRA